MDYTYKILSFNHTDIFERADDGEVCITESARKRLRNRQPIKFFWVSGEALTLCTNNKRNIMIPWETATWPNENNNMYFNSYNYFCLYNNNPLAASRSFK